MKYKLSKLTHITGDFVLNILASVIYTFARQIVVFPLLAARMGDADYGTLLTVIGLVNVATAIVGNVLNNVRLIQNSTYQERELSGDFNWICAIGSVLSVIFVAVVGWIFHLALLTIFLLCAYVCVSNFYVYATAHFRLNLDFKRNLIVHCLISIAYIPFVYLCGNATWWPVVFLAAEGFGLVYTIYTTRFYREGFGRTPLLRETSGKFFALVLGSLIGNLLLYADRIIIYPIIGAESVSYYSAASLFGKSAGMVMTPIAGVLLGYFSQKNFKASKKLFLLVNGISLVCLAVFLVGCWLLAPWFTELLYPTLFSHAKPYIFLANLGAVISIAGNMAQPMILKCCSTKWQLFITCIYTAAYLIFALWLMPIYGLLGFCWATIFANSVRLVVLYLIGFIKF